MSGQQVRKSESKPGHEIRWHKYLNHGPVPTGWEVRSSYEWNEYRNEKHWNFRGESCNHHWRSYGKVRRSGRDCPGFTIESWQTIGKVLKANRSRQLPGEILSLQFIMIITPHEKLIENNLKLLLRRITGHQATKPLLWFYRLERKPWRFCIPLDESRYTNYDDLFQHLAMRFGNKHLEQLY